jgi:hypothetical protein
VDDEVNHLIEGRIETARQLHNSTKAVQQKLRSEATIRRLWKYVRICERRPISELEFVCGVLIREVLQMMQSRTAHDRQIATLVNQTHALKLIAICHTYVVKARGS